MRIAKRMLKNFKLTGLRTTRCYSYYTFLLCQPFALIAVSNLIRNLLMFSGDRDHYPSGDAMAKPRYLSPHLVSNQFSAAPGVMDTAGNLIKDPLLVMRSISVEDAREQLDPI